MAYQASLLIHRFWSKVDMSGVCWVWTGSPRSGNAYGKFMTRKGYLEGAHRVAYMLACGDIPLGLQVLHSCDNRRCVRPEHLFTGTQLDNMRDMIAKGRAARGKELNHPPQAGESNNFAKLTEGAVREFKARIAQGERRSRVARSLGITRANAWAIVHGKSWAHV